MEVAQFVITVVEQPEQRGSFMSSQEKIAVEAL
jgi:hypothetical protein